MTTSFLILTSDPQPSTLEFADALAQLIPNVIVVADLEPKAWPRRAELVHVRDEDSVRAGYFRSSHLIAKTPIAWDKALYLNRERLYQYAWCCEDDVLFASPAVAARLVKSLEACRADLICQGQFTEADRPDWAHWHTAGKFPAEHRRGSFLPLCRISSNLVSSVERYSQRTGSLTFIETMLPSLVAEDGLTALALSETLGPAFRWAPDFSHVELLERLAFGHEVFHPVKSDKLRSSVARRAASGGYGVLELALAAWVSIGLRFALRLYRKLARHTKAFALTLGRLFRHHTRLVPSDRGR
jgi:hypothetical protein